MRMAGEHSQAELPRMGGPKMGGSARFAPHQKPKNGRRTFGRLAVIFLRYKGVMIVSILLTVLSAGVSVAVPVLTGRVFNTFSIASRTVDAAKIAILLAALVSLYAGQWISDTVSTVMILTVSQKLVSVLRSEFFAQMQRLPLKFFDTTARGDTMSRITNDVDTISSTIAQSAAQLITGVCSTAGSIIVMLALNIPLTFAVLVSVPFVVLVTKMIAGRSRNYFYSQQKNLGILNGQIEETIHEFKMVKAFAKEDETLSRFAIVNSDLCTSSARAQIWSGFMMPLMNVINNLTFALVAISGGVLCTSRGLAIGIVVAFMGYAKQFVRPLNAVASLFNTIQSALASAERVFEVMDETQETPDASGAVDFVHPKGDVSFENVCFSYDKKKPVLKNITFSVEAGHTVALVGETGSGKTTIVNLLNRFYDADSGTIFIDGTDIRQIKRGDLRNCFSVVLQETSMFSGTIMENIRYARPNASDDEVRHAARIAHAAEFIEKMPHRYETKVSGSADSLSEGQRQLLAISRAVLCNSPILILDEATSSVDTKTEKEIQRALVSLRQGRTCFLIAHRLSTIRDAGCILVIDGGEIIEQGTHEQLMNSHGHYYDMVVSQTGEEKKQQ
jgi:ATP-binding cassette, subfamily B, multidrug efflux pump